MLEAYVHSLLVPFLKASGFIAFAPIVNDIKMPVVVKTLLAFAFAMVLVNSTVTEKDIRLLDYIGLVSSGCLLGIICRLPLFFLHIAVSAFGQSFSLSQYLNTGQDTVSGVVGEIYKWGVCGVLASTGALWVAAEGLLIDISVNVETFFEVADWFLEVSLQVIAPFLFFSVIFNLLSGFINRAMPQLMVMLVYAPLSVLLAMIFNVVFFQSIVTIWLSELIRTIGF
ncbi:flagellar biosynthetic protein FliR [Donghicola sp. XS_ASV15]|uniref:flagellar biosynthetic protein FliR n=1 Tax=Donghicola sp. XS_ASV15 TaxID=3241295 RepID=UPI0035172417